MKNQIPSHLTEWLKESGIEEMYHDTPQNRLDSLDIDLSQGTSKILKKIKDDTLSLAEVHTITALREIVENFDGCSLKKTAMNTVFSDGNPNASVMLIGEAPGAEEDKMGKPFVGQSGKLLRRILSFVGLTIDHIYISNVIHWRPPGNRPPTPAEIEICLPFLQKHIALVKPKIIILVGATAVKAILNAKEGITKIHGKWFDYESEELGYSIPVMPIFHPAFLLRSPSKKKDVWQDVLKIKHKLKTLES